MKQSELLILIDKLIADSRKVNFMDSTAVMDAALDIRLAATADAVAEPEPEMV